jgi:hypothetical protein
MKTKNEIRDRRLRGRKYKIDAEIYNAILAMNVYDAAVNAAANAVANAVAKYKDRWHLMQAVREAADEVSFVRDEALARIEKLKSTVKIIKVRLK